MEVLTSKIINVEVLIYVIQSKILPALGNTHSRNTNLLVELMCGLVGTEEINNVTVEKHLDYI